MYYFSELFHFLDKCGVKSPLKYKDKYDNGVSSSAMTRSRGRPVIPIPLHPERVISRAIKAGLSATIRLQRNICNKTTRKYYDRSKERWRIRQEVYQVTKERGVSDFSHISKAEASVRDDARLMFYENAAKYGYSEVSRQKNTDDTVNPLNRRFNTCGVVVRENSEIMFPLPDPVSFGTYTRRDGKGRKEYRRVGYESSSFGPRVILAHPDLPALDFGDAVRSHNEYLATYCAIHDVSVRETTRYSQLFFLLVRPYLEHLYSEFKCGKADFQKGVNWALRQVKELLLETGYRPTMYEKRTVTKELDFNERMNKRENKSFFKKQENEAREFYGNHPAVTELNRLQGKLGEDEGQIDQENECGEDEPTDDDTIFTVKDVDHIKNEMSKRARVAGSIMHRRIADLFPSPWNLNDVIYAGNKYTHSSDYIIISEVSLQTQHVAGKVDLILCERTITKDGKRILGKPVFVLEIKTRLGQSWYFDANYKESEVRPEGSPLQRVVSEFPLSDYPLSDDLWYATVHSTPTPTARRQLDIYSQALTESYENTTEQELGHMLKGVVVIEASSDVTEIRQVLERLIVHAYENVKNRTRRLKRMVFTPPESDSSRIALVVDEQPAPRRKEENTAKASWGPAYTPFKTKKKTKRDLILYLAGHSPTSAGRSAAWNARYYHGLQMLCDMKKPQDNTEIVWLDLASQVNEPRLAEARLRLRPRGCSEEEVAKVQPDHIQEFFENIKVKGYLDDILTFLYNDGDIPSFELRSVKNKRKVIIITGADTLRDATPSSHREQLSVLIDHILSQLPDDEKTTIVWFDSSVPSVERSIPYSSRALLPYYETSPLGEVVTEIIWNLPTAPKSAVQPEKWGLPIIGDSPMHDDIRVIIRHSQTEFQMELSHVPFLRGWSKRFRNQGTGLVIQERDVDDIVPEKTTRHRMKLLSLTLLPWLVRLWSHEKLREDSTETLEEQITDLMMEYRGGAGPLRITRKTLPEPPSKPPSLLELVKFRLPETMDALSFQTMTAGKINSRRLYRSPRKLQTRPLQEITVPVQTEEADLSEPETIFGIRFEVEGDPTQPWWMVIQDPAKKARMLVGCFRHKIAAKNGFLWAETDQQTLIQHSLEDVLGMSQTVLMGERSGEGMMSWSVRLGEDEAFDPGLIEVIGGGRSTVGPLRAVRQTLSGVTKTRLVSGTQPTETFYNRVVDALRRFVESVTMPTPVSVCLEMEEDECQVTFTDEEESEVLQTVTLEYTAALISLLRWPMTKGGPMYTDSGTYVTWSVFEDIQFGNLDFLRPYVVFRAARAAPEELPERVVQFFEDAETVHVSIEHDHSSCPMVTEWAGNHGECWRITLPSDCPEPVKKQLGKIMTGEEVNGLLAPGRLYAEKLYLFDVSLPTVSEKDESVVFHEDRYIRMFLRDMGLPLKSLEPGTFLLVPEQEWIVDITLDGRSYLKWSAQSTVSDLFLRNGRRTIELVHGNGIKKECKRVMDIITSDIPQGRIVGYSELEERVMSKLRTLGYSKSSPPCELRVLESTMDVFRYGVYQRGVSSGTPLMTSNIQATCGQSPDTIVEMMETSMSEGDLSHYSIRNTTSFKKRLATWVQEFVQVTEEDWSEDEDAEQEEEWKVTLYVTIGRRAVSWEATQKDNDEYPGGILDVDEKVLVDGDIEEAEQEVREAFEVEVVPKLTHITNLEDVLETQVPEVVREIRSQGEE